MNISKIVNDRDRVRRIIATAAIVMLLLVFFMYTYVRRSIHNERVVHLKAQTETTRNLINATISEYANYADICSRSISNTLEPGDDVREYLSEMKDVLVLDTANLILVDSNCIWYSDKNDHGRINETSMYTDKTGRQEIYITEEVFSGRECIVCRNRLTNPIEVKTDNGSAVIEYCASICYLDELDYKLTTAFPHTSNRFILNEKGGMLYKRLELGSLIGGSNIYSKFERVQFLYGDKGSELVENIKKGKTTIGEFKNDGGHYFVCAARLRYNDWALCYVLNTDNLASGSYVGVVVLFVSAMSLLFLAVFFFTIWLRAQADKAKREVEAEKRANELLGQVAKSKSDFLSNMSHDIRTPINGIMGMTALAKKEQDPEKMAEYLKKIEGASEHLLSLVNDVLDMSSLESGKVTINKKAVDMNKLPGECVAMLQSQAEGKDIAIIEEFEKLSKPVLMADEIKLKQIVLNILGNAIKYTPEGGRIVYRTSAKEVPDSRIVNYMFEIEDNGIGMKPEFLDKIWDSFSQEDGGSRTNYKGTGLGMSITKSFVELMGGEIEVSSELNKGSVFKLMIPLELCEDEVFEEYKAVDEEQSISGIKLLLVEDNELNIEIAEELLLDEGVIVTKAYNGKQALEIFANSEPASFDIVLMDVMMPEMNGIEACEAIRRLDREDAVTVPIIAMTANALEENVEETKAAGMNAHLSKPIDIQLLVRTIATLLNR